MSEELKGLIDWKTDAWKNPDMVAWYANRMFENTGTNQLKHQLEMALIARYATGPTVLDVGIGTGRGSLPLARRGMQVTGVDSSQAMLDETRRQAGETPITLTTGDVANLPVPDASFDFVLSLNVVVHFPHWDKILDEWQRVVKPGGRLMFDIHSLDHLEAVYGAGEPAEKIARAGEAEGQYGSYMSMARARDILAWADTHGFSVVDIVPVGGFVVSTANHWLADLERKHWWNRLLGWMTTDQKLFDFALWLEQEIVWRLTTAATGRFMVILDATPDPERNAAWLAGQELRNRALAEGQVERALGVSPQKISQGIRMQARHPRCAYLLYQLLAGIGAHAPEQSFDDWLPDEIRRMFADWRLQEQIDQYSLALASQWREADGFDNRFALKGVPIGPGLDYPLMRDILTDYLGIFNKGESA
ncbi:Methyltransferase domain-containing protein [Formivibrio citricus]|uniref:Methyltransferase domain-containing protein n=1 Tax=Formivibrio citricus TaxID=83765 RepID=A0A1I4VBD9_9NEIS|nr:class I SAM-dependent methyltransferase [Formivibrio citricus]SFM98511.1 Methyltransferase domain-containing protein [Formivibrio citricus]